MTVPPGEGLEEEGAIGLTDLTIEDVKILERAIVSGQQTVRYRDRTITYRSLDEMMRALDYAKRALGVDQDSRRRRIHPEYDSGL